VLGPLRARFAVPFVGTVPAVKPAAEQSRSRLVSVLATPGTVRREYTRELIATHGGNCCFTLVGSAELAGLVERVHDGQAVPDAAFAAEIAPCFVTEGDRRTDTVVLACTHYPLVLDRLERLAPWPVRWIDPAPAIARRVVAVTAGSGAPGKGARRFRATGRLPDGAFLAGFDFPPGAVISIPS
jgi:glutamate racemase